MAVKPKPSEQLDGMIEHIRYELQQLLNFVIVSNGWCSILRPDLAQYTQNSLLEAALIHLRALIEFLDENPNNENVVAREYVTGWEWRKSGELTEEHQLHARLAHLGKVRCSVAASGPFEWAPWLNTQAPVVLRTMRDFLMRLRDEAPERYELFMQPNSTHLKIDFIAVIDAVLG